jgi:hypothetical protein
MAKWIVAPDYAQSAGCYYGCAMVENAEHTLTSARRNGPWYSGTRPVEFDGERWVLMVAASPSEINGRQEPER